MSVPLRIEHISVDERDVPRPLRHRRVSRRMRRLAGFGAISALLSVLGLAGVGALTLLNCITSTSNLQLVGSGSTGALHAVAGSAHRSYGYVTVSGSVSNTGSHRTSNVEAVVELIDSQNRTVQLDKSTVAVAGGQPGDTSPFRVIVQDDPSAVGYRLSFKHPDGRAID
jgi:hypothetical protein